MKRELKRVKNNILKCKHFGMQLKMFSSVRLLRHLFVRGLKKVFP